MIGEIFPEAISVARAIFGGGGVEVAPLERGVMTFKFTVQLPDDKRYVLRFYPRSRAQVVEYEPDLLLSCATQGLCVPRLFTDSRRGPKARLPYCIYEYIDGTPLANRLAALDETTLEQLAADLLRNLHLLGGVEVRGFGELVTGKKARFDDWFKFLDTVFAEGIAGAIRSNLWPEDVVDDLRVLRSRIHAIPPPLVRSLALGDLSPENILLDPENRLAGLLDLEGVVAGELLLNAGYCCARFPNAALYSAILRAWPTQLSPADSERIHLYAILRALSIARFTHEPLPSGIRRIPIERLLPGVRPAIRSLHARLCHR